MFPRNYLWPGASRTAWQWQTSLTAHDPNPPITLEDGAAPPADDPETRFWIEQVWHGHDDAFDELLQQIIEAAAAAADDSETRALFDENWQPEFDAPPEPELQVEDSVEGLLVPHDAPHDFDEWADDLLQQLIDAPALVDDPEARALFEDGWQPDYDIPPELAAAFQIEDSLESLLAPIADDWQPEYDVDLFLDQHREPDDDPETRALFDEALDESIDDAVAEPQPWADWFEIVAPTDGAVWPLPKYPRRRPEEIERERKMVEEYLDKLDRRAKELRRAKSARVAKRAAPEPQLTEAIVRAASAEQLRRIAESRAAQEATRARVVAERRRRALLILLALDD